MPSESRTVRYFGLLRLTDEMKRAKQLQVFHRIIRPPFVNYQNLIYHPNPETYFGVASPVKDEFTVDAIPLRYDFQVILSWVNVAAYIKQAVSCQHDAVLTSFVELATALGLTVIRRNNPIKDWEDPILDFDTIQIDYRHENTVGEVTVVWEPIETCEVPEAEPPEYEPPVPPPFPTPPLPPDTPDENLPEISPPYVAPDDGGRTYIPEEPIPDLEGDECVAYIVQLTIFSTLNPSGFPGTGSLYGEYGGFRIDPANSQRIEAYSRGEAFDGANPLPCLEPGYYGVFSVSNGQITNFTVNSVTPA